MARDWTGRLHGMDYLRRHVAAGGSTRIPRTYVNKEGFALGQFITNQRSSYRQGKLPPERIRELEAISDWVWDIGYDDFDPKVGRIELYAKRTGSSRVPEGYTDKDGFKLGDYVLGLRRRHRRGRLTQAQINRLESLPFWSWNPYEDDWEDAFQTLKDYLATIGSVRGIPLSLHSASGIGIRTWAGNQRKEQDRIRQERPDRFERLGQLPGWQWTLDTWDEWFETLNDFVAAHGHARVPTLIMFQGKHLGHWISNQRQAYRRKTLPQDRIHKLQALPGWLWDASMIGWQNSCDDLASFVDRFGHSEVPYIYRSPDNGFALGAWVSRLRKLVKDGTLTNQQRKAVRAALTQETLIKPRSLSKLFQTRRRN